MNTPSVPAEGATLRLLDKADREIAKLDQKTLGAVYGFQRDFRKAPVQAASTSDSTRRTDACGPRGSTGRTPPTARCSCA